VPWVTTYPMLFRQQALGAAKHSRSVIYTLIPNNSPPFQMQNIASIRNNLNTLSYIKQYLFLKDKFYGLSCFVDYVVI
jgi:hypothetical protein